MITASPQTIRLPLNHVKSGGWYKASAPPASTQTGNRFAIQFSINFMTINAV
jgi:hypothetical protein